MRKIVYVVTSLEDGNLGVYSDGRVAFNKAMAHYSDFNSDEMEITDLDIDSTKPLRATYDNFLGILEHNRNLNQGTI